MIKSDLSILNVIDAPNCMVPLVPYDIADVMLLDIPGAMDAFTAQDGIDAVIYYAYEYDLSIMLLP